MPAQAVEIDHPLPQRAPAPVESQLQIRDPSLGLQAGRLRQQSLGANLLDPLFLQRHPELGSGEDTGEALLAIRQPPEARL